MRIEKRRLQSRCAKVEQEIVLNENFNAEFTPRKQRKLRKTRWDFDALNKENALISSFARRAFDPSNRFLDYPKPSYDEDVEIIPMITEPHRITTGPPKRNQNVHRFVDKYDDSAYVPKAGAANRSSSSVRTSRRSIVHSACSSSKTSTVINMDDTVDRFVDDLEKLRE